MSLSSACREDHRRIVAGVCSRCGRTISNGYVQWHVPRKDLRAQYEIPFAASPCVISLVDEWHDDIQRDHRWPFAEISWNHDSYWATLSLLALGETLQPWEFQRVEDALHAQPNALWIRVILLGECMGLSKKTLFTSKGVFEAPTRLEPVDPPLEPGVDRSYLEEPERRRVRQRAVEWILEHAPRSCIAKRMGIWAFAHFQDKGPDYVEAKRLWFRALESQPTDAGLLAGAARFFTCLDPTLSGELIRNAKALEPEKALWSKQLGYLYALETMARQDESRRDWAAMTLAELEHAATLDRGGSEDVRLSSVLAWAALEANELVKASEYASRMGKTDTSAMSFPWYALFEFWIRRSLAEKSDLREPGFPAASTLTPRVQDVRERFAAAAAQCLRGICLGWDPTDARGAFTKQAIAIVESELSRL
jgi:hypothetical protein